MENPALSKLTVLPELCAEEADSSVRELSVEPQSRVSAAASQPSAWLNGTTSTG